MPNPEEFWAEWKESGGGARKKSRNLWVYEKKSGKKRYSITTQAGAKIQPYFDVPPPNDPNIYKFTVQGEAVSSGLIRVWLTKSTALFLERIIGSLDTEHLEKIISDASMLDAEVQLAAIEPGIPVLITERAYSILTEKFKGISDEHRFQLLIQFLLADKPKP